VDNVILKILGGDEWAQAKRGGEIRSASLAEVGFVHCADPGTVHIPANALFAGRKDLVLLVVDPGRLDVPVRWEAGVPPHPAGLWFPHVYGPIPLAAVVAAHEFPPGPNGRFELPPVIADPGRNGS
jgi:uncharacterized protein (DUF952 family)